MEVPTVNMKFLTLNNEYKLIKFFFLENTGELRFFCIKIEENGFELHSTSRLRPLAHLWLDYMIKAQA